MKENKHKIVGLLYIFCFLSQWVVAQELTPKGFFSRDSIKIGDTIRYMLSVKHHAKQQVLFPDTNFNFTPFEIIKKQHFPTRTLDSISTDSAIYWLTTFELDSIQSLSLPIYWLKGKDSVTFYAEEQAIYLQPVINDFSDSLQIQSDTQFLPVELEFNYPYWIIGIVLFLCIALIIIVFFSKHVERIFKAFLLRKRYGHFIKVFRQLEQELLEVPSAEKTEKLVSFWKKYLEKLTQIPFTTFTTKEVHGILKDEVLQQALRQTDSYIYGGKKMENTMQVTTTLSLAATQLYKEKRKEVLNEK